jgi:hypothetical protein
MDDAAELMFAAWGLLPNPTTNPAIKQQMCNAHAATVYQAALLFPGSALHIAAADLAWTAVGRGYGPDTGIDGDCQPPNDFQNTDPPGPEPPNFAPQMPVRSIVLGQGGSGSLSVAPSDETHTFAATGGGSATLTFNAPHTQLGISVPPDMPGGVYPLLVSESDGPTNIAYVGAALIIDSDPPTVSVNSVSLAATGQIGASGAGTVPLLVDWSANDDGTGIDGSALEKSSTGSFPGTTVATGGAGGSSTVTTVDATDYFLVRATDNAGNDGISSVSGPWNIGRFQEGSAIYKKTWTTAALANSWQGSVRFATAYGASARFIFTGTDVAWITTKASNRGKVKVYLDGLFKRKINLAAGTLGSRLVAYRLTGLSAGSHTLRIKIVTSGKRVDVDGYVTLNH